MQKTPYNVIFVYSLLVVDLLINITDNLISSSHSNANEISTAAFSVVIIQILAITCVIINLVLHFFDTSDQVRQFAWAHRCLSDSGDVRRSDRNAQPMAQRLALKLVLDRYWWSLLVGLLYLILTIILQIIRLDPSWHHSHPKQTMNANLKTEEPTFSSGSLLDKLLEVDETFSGDSEYNSTSFSGQRSTQGAVNLNLLPVIVLLVHKLMSTCYYVSFVVVYRASPAQKVGRILYISKTSSQAK